MRGERNMQRLSQNLNLKENDDHFKLSLFSESKNDQKKEESVNKNNEKLIKKLISTKTNLAETAFYYIKIWLKAYPNTTEIKEELNLDDWETVLPYVESVLPYLEIEQQTIIRKFIHFRLDMDHYQERYEAILDNLKDNLNKCAANDEQEDLEFYQSSKNAMQEEIENIINEYVSWQQKIRPLFKEQLYNSYHFYQREQKKREEKKTSHSNVNNFIEEKKTKFQENKSILSMLTALTSCIRLIKAKNEISIDELMTEWKIIVEKNSKLQMARSTRRKNVNNDHSAKMEYFEKDEIKNFVAELKYFVGNTKINLDTQDKIKVQDTQLPQFFKANNY